MPHQTSDDDLKEHQKAKEVAYSDERKILIEGEQASADQFDKHMVTLVAGALGVSLVFIEKIAPHPQLETLKFLYWSWVALVVSLIVILASFLTSQYGYRKQIKILEDVLFAEGSRNTKNKWAKATEWLNRISIVTFVFGVIMLVYFSISNMSIVAKDRKNLETESHPSP